MNLMQHLSCPTIYINFKHFSRLTYGRFPTKGIRNFQHVENERKLIDASVCDPINAPSALLQRLSVHVSKAIVKLSMKC